MKNMPKPLFETVNSFFSFEDKNIKRIVPIKNEFLSEIANVSGENDNINVQLFPYACEVLKKYIADDLLCEIWHCEDFEIVWEENKLKLQVDKDSILNKILDVCMGNQFNYLKTFTNRERHFSYEEFIARVNKIRVGIMISKKQEIKMMNTLDEELNECLCSNYMYYRNEFHNAPFSEFCNILLERCDLALKTKKELFEISSLTIDLDLIEEYLNVDRFYLYIAFAFIKEAQTNPTFAEWKLEFLKKIYNYAKKNLNGYLKNLYAPDGLKENGKIKMNSIETFMKKFEGLSNNEVIQEKIKVAIQKEKLNTPVKKPKEKKKIDKIPTSLIAGIEEIFIIQLILNGNQTKKEMVKHFDLFSENHAFLTLIKEKYLYSLLAKIPFLKSMNLENLQLDFNLNETGFLNITLNYVSLLESILSYFGVKEHFENCKTLDEIDDFFTNLLADYGEMLSSILDGKLENEQVEDMYEIYKKEVDDVPYDLYLTRKVDAILELLDCLPLLKTIADTNINYDEINASIDKDKYYLSIAMNLFVTLYHQVINKEKVNKEEYLFLARYIEIVKDILECGYEVKDSTYSCADLVEKYTAFVSEHTLYDLDNTNLYNAITNPESRKLLFSNWKIIPKGKEERFKYPTLQEQTKKKKGVSYSYKYSKVLERKYFFDHTDYDCMILGMDTFAGYIGYKYKNGIIIFEKFFEDEGQKRPALGNATYVMTQNNFIVHSAKSKPALMRYIKEGNKDVDRKTHTRTWKEKIMDIINNWGYDPATVQSIDSLIEASKKRKDGRKLEWKN